MLSYNSNNNLSGLSSNTGTSSSTSLQPQQHQQQQQFVMKSAPVSQITIELVTTTSRPLLYSSNVSPPLTPFGVAATSQTSLPPAPPSTPVISFSPASSLLHMNIPFTKTTNSNNDLTTNQHPGQQQQQQQQLSSPTSPRLLSSSSSSSMSSCMSSSSSGSSVSSSSSTSPTSPPVIVFISEKQFKQQQEQQKLANGGSSTPTASSVSSLSSLFYCNCGSCGGASSMRACQTSPSNQQAYTQQPQQLLTTISPPSTPTTSFRLNPAPTHHVTYFNAHIKTQPSITEGLELTLVSNDNQNHFQHQQSMYRCSGGESSSLSSSPVSLSPLTRISSSPPSGFNHLVSDRFFLF